MGRVLEQLLREFFWATKSSYCLSALMCCFSVQICKGGWRGRGALALTGPPSTLSTLAYTPWTGNKGCTSCYPHACAQPCDKEKQLQQKPSSRAHLSLLTRNARCHAQIQTDRLNENSQLIAQNLDGFSSLMLHPPWSMLRMLSV